MQGLAETKSLTGWMLMPKRSSMQVDVSPLTARQWEMPSPTK